MLDYRNRNAGKLKGHVAAASKRTFEKVVQHNLPQQRILKQTGKQKSTKFGQFAAELSGFIRLVVGLSATAFSLPSTAFQTCGIAFALKIYVGFF